MKIKLSATFEGKCSVCGNEAVVFTAGDEDTKKIVTVCKGCADSFGSTPTSEIIEKYGKVDEQPFEGGEIKIEGLDKVRKELESKIKKKRPRRKRTPV